MFAVVVAGEGGHGGPKSLVVSLLIAGLVMVAASIATRRSQDGRTAEAVSRHVLKVSRKHAGETGMIVEILWGVRPRYVLPRSAIGTEPNRWFGGGKVHFVGSSIDGRPRWVSLKPGQHDLELTVNNTGRARSQDKQTEKVTVHVDRGQQVLLLCWPSKRRFVTSERASTVWRVEQLNQEPVAERSHGLPRLSLTRRVAFVAAAMLGTLAVAAATIQISSRDGFANMEDLGNSRVIRCGTVLTDMPNQARPVAAKTDVDWSFLIEFREHVCSNARDLRRGLAVGSAIAALVLGCGAGFVRRKADSDSASLASA